MSRETGGHWETRSDRLVGGAISGVRGGQGLGAHALRADSLPEAWQFAVEDLERDPWLWLINPNGDPARVVIAICGPDGAVLAAGELQVSGHAGWVWDARDWVSALRRAFPGAFIVVHAPEGPVAVGLGFSANVSTSGKDGEWLTSAPPKLK